MADHTIPLPDFEAARRYVFGRLERELSPNLTYHSIAHTRDDILPAVERLAALEGINGDELLLLRTAALYHDIGFIETYSEHEAASMRIAVETLPEFGYSRSQIDQVCQLIKATEIPQNPDSQLTMLLADADLDILGREDFFFRNKDLYNELAAMGVELTLPEWYGSQLRLLQAHSYFTSSANALRQSGKQQNADKIRELLSGMVAQEAPESEPADSRAKLEAVLTGVPLFASLPKEEIAYLALSLRLIEHPDGELLFLEGDYGDHFYVVIDGHVEVIKALGTQDERRIGVRGFGEFIGEMSLLATDGLRTASARTVGPSRLLEMTRPDFESMLRRQPQLAAEFVRVLIARLNASHNNTIRDMQEKNTRLAQAYEELKSAQAQLIKQERLERELQVAYEIQMSILPESMPHLAGFEFGALIVPAREVGGDFFDLIPLRDGKMGIVVGDITDKGVPAAIFMAQTHALVRAVASQAKSPGKTIHQVNQLLLGMNRRNMFATILYGILDRQTCQFDYARAGHELPILLKPDGEVEIVKQGVGMPVGILQRPEIDEQTLAIPPGTTLLLYTDGVTDALVAPERRFGMQGLIDAFRRTAGAPAQQVCDRIFNSLVVDGRPELRIDDVTLVAVRSLG